MLFTFLPKDQWLFWVDIFGFHLELPKYYEAFPVFFFSIFKDSKPSHFGGGPFKRGPFLRGETEVEEIRPWSKAQSVFASWADPTEETWLRLIFKRCYVCCICIYIYTLYIYIL